MRKNYMKNGEIREGNSLHYDGKGFYTGNGRSSKSSSWKYLIALALGLIVAGILFSNFVVKAEPPTTCPAGQEPIGAGACRITPTGCPYGDSMDKATCDKYGGETNPERDYFDAEGNKYNYKGELILPVEQPPVVTTESWGK